MGMDSVGMVGPLQHVSLHEAAALARGQAFASALAGSLAATAPLTSAPATPAARTVAKRATTSGAGAASIASKTRSFSPHTAVTSKGDADPDQWDGILNRMGKKYNVPPLFLKAVMLSESGGRPDAIGDSGHSVGLFQLHDHGYGSGMGDRRFDPETNADRAAQGLSEAWHAGERKGLKGEQAVRAAYDYSFNPGGGWAYQGDSVVHYYNQLLREQGQAGLS